MESDYTLPELTFGDLWTTADSGPDLPGQDLAVHSELAGGGEHLHVVPDLVAGRVLGQHPGGVPLGGLEDVEDRTKVLVLQQVTGV